MILSILAEIQMVLGWQSLSTIAARLYRPCVAGGAYSRLSFFYGALQLHPTEPWPGLIPDLQLRNPISAPVTAVSVRPAWKKVLAIAQTPIELCYLHAAHYPAIVNVDKKWHRLQAQLLGLKLAIDVRYIALCLPNVIGQTYPPYLKMVHFLCKLWLKIQLLIHLPLLCIV